MKHMIEKRKAHQLNLFLLCIGCIVSAMLVVVSGCHDDKSSTSSNITSSSASTADSNDTTDDDAQSEEYEDQSDDNDGNNDSDDAGVTIDTGITTSCMGGISGMLDGITLLGCWYISSNGESCETTCAPYGGATGAIMTGATYNGVVYDQICACNK